MRTEDLRCFVIDWNVTYVFAAWFATEPSLPPGYHFSTSTQIKDTLDQRQAFTNMV